MVRSPDRPIFRCILFDWGGTLMSEDGPPDIAMALWPEVRAIPGAEETLSQLAATHRLAVATNARVSRRDLIPAALRRVSLDRYISEIFCFTEIGAGKDTPRFWDAVTSTLDVPARDIAMVGDCLEQDVIAPRRFGIFSVWFNEDGKHGTTTHDVPTIHRLPDFVPMLVG